MEPIVLTLSTGAAESGGVIGTWTIELWGGRMMQAPSEAAAPSAATRRTRRGTVMELSSDQSKKKRARLAPHQPAPVRQGRHPTGPQPQLAPRPQRYGSHAFDRSTANALIDRGCAGVERRRGHTADAWHDLQR